MVTVEIPIVCETDAAGLGTRGKVTWLYALVDVRKSRLIMIEPFVDIFLLITIDFK
jgi:hypothetical protein